MPIAKQPLTRKQQQSLEERIDAFREAGPAPGLHFFPLATHIEWMREVISGARHPIEYGHVLDRQFTCQGWYPSGLYALVMEEPLNDIRNDLDGYYIDSTDWPLTPEESIREGLQRALTIYDRLAALGFRPDDEAVVQYPRWEINVLGHRMPSGPFYWPGGDALHVLAELEPDEYAAVLLSELPPEAYTTASPLASFNLSIDIRYVSHWTSTALTAIKGNDWTWLQATKGDQALVQGYPFEVVDLRRLEGELGLYPQELDPFLGH